MVMSTYLMGADNHNIGNQGTSWLNPEDWGDKFGNVGKFAVDSVLSGVNSFYNTAVTVGNWFGADLTENDTSDWISSIDSDFGAYYRENRQAVDIAGGILGSIIPGMAGVKIFNAGQMALKTAANSGKLGGTMKMATGLLVPDVQRYASLAAAEINSSTTALKLLNTKTAAAIGAGFWQNTLEAAAFETMTQVTMFRSPILESQDMGDIAINVMVGGALGGTIGGALQTAKLWGGLKKAVKEESALRLPFESRPSFASITSPSERITQLSYDSNMAAVPVRIVDADGKVVNNFEVNQTLYNAKITRNNNDKRIAIHQLSGGDTEIANMLANASHPAAGEVNFAQRDFENFSGAIDVTRIKTLSKSEKEIAKAVKDTGVPSKDISNRFVTLIGEDAGKVLDSEPIVTSLGDLYKGRQAIMAKVAEHKFDIKKEWSALDLSGREAHLEAEARQIWAAHSLKELKPGSLINRYDIPLLERAIKDGVTDIKITSGVGPSLEVTRPSSVRELWDILEESKMVVANDLLKKMSLTGSIPIEQGTAAAAKIANVKQSYLEGFPSANKYDDLLAHQSANTNYLKMLKDKELSTFAAEAIDPLFLPKIAKVTYEIPADVKAVTPSVLDAMAFYKSKQRQYVDASKNVVAKILGRFSQSLGDISDTALFTASRVGESAGLISGQNANYGTIGSSMAFTGSITRAAMQEGRKTVGDALESSLVALRNSPKAAIEFESLSQKVQRSGKPFIHDDGELLGQHALVSREAGELARQGKPVDWVEGENYFLIKNQETADAITAHISESGRKTSSFREIRAVQGHTDVKDPDVFRPILPHPKDYPFLAFVKDGKVTGTGHTTMLHAASEKELGALIDRVPNDYKVITKADAESYFKARDEYQFSRTLHENYIDSDLASRGVYSSFFPKTDSGKIADDILQQHYRESDVLVRDAVRLRYEPQFNWLEDLGHQYSKIETSRFATKTEAIESVSNNPYFNHVKTALNISTANENHLLYGFNKLLDESVSKAVGSIKQAFQGVKSPEELGKINAALDEYGIKPAFYDSALTVLANHSAPKGALTSFVRGANSILSLFTLGLDPINALNNAVGANILRMTELNYLTKAISQGNTEAAGELGKIAKIRVPGVQDEILAPSKLVAKSISNFWKDDGTLLSRYKADGFIVDRVEQLKLLVDDFTLQGTETVAQLNQRLSKGFEKAKVLSEKGEKLSGNKLAEEFNRFISADVMRQITDIGISKGLLDEATAKTYINTFVNRVEGNTIASQRPLIFQGPVGQAIGLFQSYQFNLLQQLFRYVAEGTKKDLGMLLGLQGTLYGLQSMPAFQFINTHVVGQLSGNQKHVDAYDAVYGAAGKTAGDFILYGLPSNILQGNIYSRGDINPRQITVLPTTLQEIPIVAGWGKFFGSMFESVSKITQGGNVWQSILQGIEHNGISRPLAGMAQTFEGMEQGKAISTSSKGSILYSNDLMSWAGIVRLAGARPLDEAIVNDSMFRVKTYEAAQRKSLEGLNETVKTTMIGGSMPSEEQIHKFASNYAELGGKQAGFNKWMMGLYKNANVPQSQQLLQHLNNPFAYKVQLLMGGSDE